MHGQKLLPKEAMERCLVSAHLGFKVEQDQSDIVHRADAVQKLAAVGERVPKAFPTRACAVPLYD